METIFSDNRFLKAFWFSISLHIVLGILLTINLQMGYNAHNESKLLEVTLMEGPKAGGKPGLNEVTSKTENISPPPISRSPSKPAVPVAKPDLAPKQEDSAKMQQKEIPLAKREVQVAKPKEESSKEIQKTLDQVLASLRDRVKKEEEERTHLQEAMKRLSASKEGREGQGGGTGGIRGAEGGGGGALALDIYKAQITNLIWSNWNFPANIYDESRLLQLQAVVRLVVESSGAIAEYRIVKKSNDSAFDSSIVRAIERSNPLPPLPEVFKKPKEEIEVIFSVKDLVQNR